MLWVRADLNLHTARACAVVSVDGHYLLTSISHIPLSHLSGGVVCVCRTLNGLVVSSTKRGTTRPQAVNDQVQVGTVSAAS